MLPQSSRAQLVKNFGEAKAQALEDLLTRISQAADAAGIEKKERKNTRQIDSLVAEFTAAVIKAVAEVNQPTATAPGEDSDLIKELKKRITFTTETKDVKAAAPAAPSLFMPYYLGTGTPPIYQAPANNKEAEAGDLLDRLFSINQRYGAKN